MSPGEPFALYLHIPYCIKKCPYCDFNSYTVSDAESHGTPVTADHTGMHTSAGRTAPLQEERYTQALLAELTHYGAQAKWQNRPVRSIFFGGGTPSLFSPGSIARVLERAAELFAFEEPEITLEANPGTLQEELGREKLLGFKAAGVNRISMGCQSFSARKLKALGRLHSPEDSLHAVEQIVAAGFSRFNLDLMFGIEGEQYEEWEHDLTTALNVRPTHLSAYGLTIEPGTDFAVRRRKGLLTLPDEDLQASMYEYTQERLASAGLMQYEISNYAAPGEECRHNLAYWSDCEYLGIGAGAHSYAKSEAAEREHGRFGTRRSNIPKPAHYIERALAQGEATQREELLDRAQAELEFFYLGLRRRYGVSEKEFIARFGTGFTPRTAESIAELTAQALLVLEGERLRLTKRGFLYSDYVFGQLG